MMFMENLTETIILFAKLLCGFLTYLIDSSISQDCSYEFNVVYVQGEKSQYLLYYIKI